MTSAPSAFEPDEQALWVAELARAIDEAQQLAWTLGFGRGGNAQARELYGQLEAARAELEAMRYGSNSRSSGAIDPLWTESSRPSRG